MKNMRLAMKLALGFGVVLALTALLAALSWNGLSNVLDRLDKSDAMSEIIRLGLESRRQEKNFQIRRDPQSQEALSKAVAEILELAERYKAKFEVAENREQMDKVLATTKAYDAAFKGYVEREKTRLATQKAMGEAAGRATKAADAMNASQTAQMQAALKLKNGGAAMEARVGVASEAASIAQSITSVRLTIMYYIQTGKDEYLQTARDQGKTLLANISSLKSRFTKPADVAEAEAILGELEFYMKGLESYAQAVGQQKEMEDQLIQSAREMQKVCEHTRDTIKQIMFREIALSRTVLLTGALLALILGAIAALLITRAITGPVNKGLNFASSLPMATSMFALRWTRRTKSARLPPPSRTWPRGCVRWCCRSTPLPNPWLRVPRNSPPQVKPFPKARPNKRQALRKFPQASKKWLQTSVRTPTTPCRPKALPAKALKTPSKAATL
jgi:methyl-accepting chemotaxis protein